jgi:hypothetical protein
MKHRSARPIRAVLVVGCGASGTQLAGSVEGGQGDAGVTVGRDADGALQEVHLDNKETERVDPTPERRNPFRFGGDSARPPARTPIESSPAAALELDLARRETAGPPPTPVQSDGSLEQAAPLPSARVRVTPPGARFETGGGPYTVPVSISGASQLSTVAIAVTFDPRRTVQEGSFMRQGGAQATFTQDVDAQTGIIRMTTTRNDDGPGASGAGLLAALLFDAVGPGSVTLDMNGTVSTPAGNPLELEFSTATMTVQ